MRKFLKGCLITSGILVGIGILIVVISGVSGGYTLAKEALFENRLNLAGRITALDENFDREFHEEFSENFQEDFWEKEDFREDSDSEEWDEGVVLAEDVRRVDMAKAGEIQNIYVEAGAVELSIQPSPDDTFWYRADKGIRIKNWITAENKEWHIKVGGSRKAVGGSRKICLYIPKDAVVEYLAAEIGAGTLEAEGIKVNNADIQIGAGLGKFHDMNVGNLEFEVGAGKVSYMGIVQGNIEIECGAGDVDMNLFGKEQDWNYETNLTMGSIHVGSWELNSLVGSREVDNQAGKDCSIDCGMGHVQIRFS